MRHIKEVVLIRVYGGGVILVSPRSVEAEYSKSASLNVLEKQAILAANLT